METVGNFIQRAMANDIRPTATDRDSDRLRTLDELRAEWARLTPEQRNDQRDRYNEAMRLYRHAEAVERFHGSIGARLAGCTLNNYHCDHPGQAAFIAALREYDEHLPARVAAGTNIVIHGGVGTGKDHVLSALGTSACRIGMRARWAYGPSLWAGLRRVIGTGRMEDEIIGPLIRANVLILSDPATAGVALTPYQSQVLAEVVDERWRHRQPTWCSLNTVTGTEADALLGAATVDRLRDHALVLATTWPSHRRPGNGKGTPQI